MAKVETVVVVGIPTFVEAEVSKLSVILGEEPKVGKRYGERVISPTEVGRELDGECVDVVRSLHRMGLRPVGIYPQQAEFKIRETITAQVAIDVVKFPDVVVPSTVAFPRDLATVLPNGVTLVSTGLARHLATLGLGGIVGPVIANPYSEGGRIIHTDKIALVAEHYNMPEGAQSVQETLHLEPLKAAGLKVAVMPNAAKAATQYSGWRVKMSFDDHLDRSMSDLVVDARGDHHVIVSPKLLLMNWDRPDEPWNTQDAHARFRKLLHGVGVKMHIAAKLNSPLGFGSWREGGDVLIGADEPDVREIMVRILGKKHVYVTERPFLVNQRSMSAGIRCLVNRLPKWLVNLGEKIERSD